MVLTPIATTVVYITDEGKIMTQFDCISETELVKTLDDPGTRGTRDPHEHSYVYAGVVRLAYEHHAVLEEKVSRYIGDRKPSRSESEFYGDAGEGVTVDEGNGSDIGDSARRSHSAGTDGNEDVAEQGADESGSD